MKPKLPPFAVVIHAEQLLDGSRTAILITETRHDTCQETPGGPRWPHELCFEHDKRVHAARFGPNTKPEFYVGQMVAVASLPSLRRIPVQITAIRMVRIAELTDEDARALGYESREAFFQQRPHLVDRLGWFVYVVPISQAVPQ